MITFQIEIGWKPKEVPGLYIGWRYLKFIYFHFLIIYLRWFYIKIGRWT